MNGINRIAQMITVYQNYHRNSRYWIALFEFFLMASVVNAYHIYNIHFRNEKFSHLNFQRSIATTLIKNCHSHRRRGPYSQLVNQDPPQSKHHWQKLQKKAYCRPCKDRKAPRPANERTKRKVLGEVSGNVPKKQRKRVSEVLWECSACKIPCCRRNPECWKQLHGRGSLAS